MSGAHHEFLLQGWGGAGLHPHWPKTCLYHSSFIAGTSRVWSASCYSVVMLFISMNNYWSTLLQERFYYYYSVCDDGITCKRPGYAKNRNTHMFHYRVATQRPHAAVQVYWSMCSPLPQHVNDVMLTAYCSAIVLVIIMTILSLLQCFRKSDHSRDSKRVRCL